MVTETVVTGHRARADDTGWNFEERMEAHGFIERESKRLWPMSPSNYQILQEKRPRIG
jgi:hypothetical protein